MVRTIELGKLRFQNEQDLEAYKQTLPPDIVLVRIKELHGLWFMRVRVLKATFIN